MPSRRRVVELLMITYMKKLLLSVVLFLFGIALFGQQSEDATIKFLGIPIDGSESQMVAKIKGKGFVYDARKECYTGQFNGKNVELHIVTNHGVVYRICVYYPEMTESRVITEYNILLDQFKRNSKYLDDGSSKSIPQSEDISYEMSIRNKEYGAGFSYLSPDIFTEEDIQKILETFLPIVKLPTQEDIVNAYQALSVEDQEFFMEKIPYLAMGQVWFKIFENFGDYQIAIYYDNLVNAPHGEDL